MGFSQLFSKTFSLWECEWVKVRSCGSRGLVQVRAQVCGRICTADEWSSSSVLSVWEGPGGTLRLRYLDVTGQVQLTGPHPLPRLSLSVRVSKPGGALAFPCWWPQRLGSLALWPKTWNPSPHAQAGTAVPVCQSSHHVFPNASPTSWTFLRSCLGTGPPGACVRCRFHGGLPVLRWGIAMCVSRWARLFRMLLWPQVHCVWLHP